MNDQVDPPNEDVEPPDKPSGGSELDPDRQQRPVHELVRRHEEPHAERAAEAPPTIRELGLAREARHLVPSWAKLLAKKFPRILRDDGLLTFEDLVQLGEEALLRAARAHRVTENPEKFTDYARYHVRGAMLDAIDELLFEERVKRAAMKAEDNYCAFFVDTDYNVMKHDAAEARRRYRAFANGLLAATFAAGVEAAQQGVDASELALQRQYEHALAILRRGLAFLPSKDRQMLALMYHDLLDLKAASTVLGIPYPTARARHKRALVVLHELLIQGGVAYAPRPLVVPHVGDVLEARAPPPENDTDPSEMR
jgi:RNA polymerase sigma factor (sigma-70 family)